MCTHWLPRRESNVRNEVNHLPCSSIIFMATFQERLDECFSKDTTKAQGGAFELLVKDYYQKTILLVLT